MRSVDACDLTYAELRYDEATSTSLIGMMQRIHANLTEVERSVQNVKLYPGSGATPLFRYNGRDVVQVDHDFTRDGYYLRLEGNGTVFLTRQMWRDLKQTLRGQCDLNYETSMVDPGPPQFHGFSVTYGTRVVDPRPGEATYQPQVLNVLPAAPEKPVERVQARTSVIRRYGFGGLSWGSARAPLDVEIKVLAA